MKLLKRFFILLLILGLFTIGCQKDEQLPVHNLMENAGYERIFKNDNITDYLNQFIEDIEALVDEGVINEGQSNALIVKINAANKSLDKGNHNAAINQLNSFINEVIAFINIGVFTAEQGQSLIILVDSRDWQVYKTVQIGNQLWMDENLNYGTQINGSQNQLNNEIVEKYCYGNNELNCNTYGGLYQWDEMMQYVTKEGAQGICPKGWHLPSDEEWSTLTNYLSGGCRTYIGSFYGIGNAAYFWSSSSYEYYSNAWSRVYSYNGVARVGFNRRLGLSVRCIKN